MHHYYYDAESRPVQVDGTLGTCSTAAACYVYDANGLRVQKTIGSSQTSYLFDLSGNVVAEDYGAGWAPGYVYAGGQLIAEYKNGTTYFVHGNHLGSSSILTSVAGGVLDCDAFYPFGEQDISICISSNSTSHKFTGDERDTETNLDHTWFRQYTSAQGRWMTPDPAGLAAVDPTNPQSWNRYAYVLNDPLNFIDPLGLDCGDAGWELVDVTGWIWSGEAWYPFSTTIWAQVKHKGCHDPQRTGGSRGGDGGGGDPAPKPVQLSPQAQACVEKAQSQVNQELKTFSGYAGVRIFGRALIGAGIGAAKGLPRAVRTGNPWAIAGEAAVTAAAGVILSMYADSRTIQRMQNSFMDKLSACLQSSSIPQPPQ